MPENEEIKDEKPKDKPNLDQVHESEQRKVDAEDAGEDKKEDEKVEEKPEEEVEEVEDKEEEVIEEKPEKPVKIDPKKVSVKAFDGKTHQFDSLDEVPDDFEPASYKEWGRAVLDFDRKAKDDKQQADNEAKEQLDKDNAKAAKDLEKSWETDIKDLAKEGLLPKDLKERGEAAQEVYDYMQSQVDKGVVVNNFREAFKAVSYEKMAKEKADKDKKANDLKKQRGGMVQSGGAPNSRPGVRRGPPPGVSLDQLHQHTIANL